MRADALRDAQQARVDLRVADAALRGERRIELAGDEALAVLGQLAVRDHPARVVEAGEPCEGKTTGVPPAAAMRSISRA